MHSPTKEKASWIAMLEIERFDKKCNLSKKLIAGWRYCFAETCLTPEDYSYLPKVAIEYWR